MRKCAQVWAAVARGIYLAWEHQRGRRGLRRGLSVCGSSLRREGTAKLNHYTREGYCIVGKGVYKQFTSSCAESTTRTHFLIQYNIFKLLFIFKTCKNIDFN